MIEVLVFNLTLFFYKNRAAIYLAYVKHKGYTATEQVKLNQMVTIVLDEAIFDVKSISL